jgi:hypothetical protein
MLLGTTSSPKNHSVKSVVYGYVHEDPARTGGIGDIETRRVMLIAGPASQNRWATNEALFHFMIGIAVRLIETTREPTHDFEMRSSLRFRDDISALEFDSPSSVRVLKHWNRACRED